MISFVDRDDVKLVLTARQGASAGLATICVLEMGGNTWVQISHYCDGDALRIWTVVKSRL